MEHSLSLVVRGIVSQSLPTRPSPAIVDRPPHERPSMARRKPHSFSTTNELWREVAQAAAREHVSQSTVISRALLQYFSTKVTRSSWDTDEESSWYNAKKFYTYSEDKKGHSIQIRLWVPKNLAGQVGRVVNSGQIPEYKSPQDFYRDSLFHRAHDVAEWLDDGELKAEVGMAILLAEEDAINQMKRDAEALIEATRSNLQEAWDKGEYEWLEEHINGRIEKASSVPEQFRADYMDLLKGYKKRLKEVAKGTVRNIRRGRADTAN